MENNTLQTEFASLYEWLRKLEDKIDALTRTYKMLLTRLGDLDAKNEVDELDVE